MANNHYTLFPNDTRRVATPKTLNPDPLVCETEDELFRQSPKSLIPCLLTELDCNDESVADDLPVGMNNNTNTTEQASACESRLLSVLGFSRQAGEGSHENFRENNNNNRKKKLLTKKKKHQQQQESINVTPQRSIIDYSGWRQPTLEPEHIAKNDVVVDKEKPIGNLGPNPYAGVRMPWYPPCARVLFSEADPGPAVNTSTEEHQQSVIFDDMVVSVLASVGVETENGNLESEPGTPRLGIPSQRGPRFQRLGEGVHDRRMWMSWDHAMRQRENRLEEQQQIEEPPNASEECVTETVLDGAMGDSKEARAASAVVEGDVSENDDGFGGEENVDELEGAGAFSEDDARKANARWWHAGIARFVEHGGSAGSTTGIAPLTLTEPCREYAGGGTSDSNGEGQTRPVDNVQGYLEDAGGEASERNEGNRDESDCYMKDMVKAKPHNEGTDYTDHPRRVSHDLHKHSRMEQQSPPDSETQYHSAGTVSERALAGKWMLFDPDKGIWMFLGPIILDVEVHVKVPERHSSNGEAQTGQSPWASRQAADFIIITTAQPESGWRIPSAHVTRDVSIVSLFNNAWLSSEEEQEQQQEQQQMSGTPQHCIIDYSGWRQPTLEPEPIADNVVDKEKQIGKNVGPNPNAGVRMPWYPSCARVLFPEVDTVKSMEAVEEKQQQSVSFDDVVLSVLATVGVETETGKLESEPGTQRLDVRSRRGPRFQRLGEGGHDRGMWMSWDHAVRQRKEYTGEAEPENNQETHRTSEEYYTAPVSDGRLADGAVVDAVVERDVGEVKNAGCGGCGGEGDTCDGPRLLFDDKNNVANTWWHNQNAALSQQVRSAWRMSYFAAATCMESGARTRSVLDHGEYGGIGTRGIAVGGETKQVGIFLGKARGDVEGDVYGGTVVGCEGGDPPRRAGASFQEEKALTNVWWPDEGERCAQPFRSTWWTAGLAPATLTQDGICGEFGFDEAGYNDVERNDGDEDEQKGLEDDGGVFLEPAGSEFHEPGGVYDTESDPDRNNIFSASPRKKDAELFDQIRCAWHSLQEKRRQHQQHSGASSLDETIQHTLSLTEHHLDAVVAGGFVAPDSNRLATDSEWCPNVKNKLCSVMSDHTSVTLPNMITCASHNGQGTHEHNNTLCNTTTTGRGPVRQYTSFDSGNGTSVQNLSVALLAQPSSTHDILVDAASATASLSDQMIAGSGWVT
ncbi:hypothetical protein HK102_010889 [Quaeritorhiza haematococci]|nr:hypothetical protein HK102_010889 [Quaeritorhiza haematococci]